LRKNPNNNSNNLNEIFNNINASFASNNSNNNNNEGSSSVTFLQLIRSRISNTIGNMLELCEQLKREHNISTMRVVCDVRRGFHFALDVNEVEKLPQEIFFSIHQNSSTSGGGIGSFFQNKQQQQNNNNNNNKSKVTCTTTDLVCLNKALDDAYAEALICQNETLNYLLHFVRQRLGQLHTVAESLGLLDFLCSLSVHANICMNSTNTNNNFGVGVVIPEFFDNKRKQQQDEDDDDNEEGFVLQDFKSITVVVHHHHQNNNNDDEDQEHQHKMMMMRNNDNNNMMMNTSSSTTNLTSDEILVAPSGKMKMTSKNFSRRDFFLPPKKKTPVVVAPTVTTAICTGPNGSGKSSLLRDVGHICILAHLGGLLPCGNNKNTNINSQDFPRARIPLLDAIFFRDSTGDASSAAGNGFQTRKLLSCSRFTHDLKETARIVKNVEALVTNNNNNNNNYSCPSTLVLFDELARGTSSREGAAVASSVMSYLAQLNENENSKKIFCILATHHLSIASSLPEKYPHLITAVQMEVALTKSQQQQNNNNLTPIQDLEARFGIRSGKCQIPQYGILLAKTARLPARVIEEALRIQDDLAFERMNLENINNEDDDDFNNHHDHDSSAMMMMMNQQQEENQEQDSDSDEEEEECENIILLEKQSEESVVVDQD
jgi:DNA mismatch repair ATPase MutS